MGTTKKIKNAIGRALNSIRQEAKVLKGEEGKDKTYSSKKVYESSTKARLAFAKAKKKLFDVNGWSDIPRPWDSVFAIYSQQGQMLEKEKITISDLIRIDLPGPFPSNWVQVIDLKDSAYEAEFTVRPCASPLDDSSQKTAHFFSSEATSKFKVEQVGKEVRGYEIGKNEVINNQEEAGDRGLVNTVVSEGGWLGFQSLQWNMLTEYLVQDVYD